MPSVLKCKMCGGDILVNADMTVGTCQYCGSTMTLPHIDTDKKARIFNRANQYRLNCEFDKAYDAYNMIANEDEQEAEAYWGMLLSEYGVEYVEDPRTKRRIPTCHRTVLKPITSNSNYELACKYADIEGKMIYQDEANELDKLQRSIISTSTKEEPYDVFICYKETDDDGQRTEDSVLAQNIFTELEKEGIKAFFARITLEEHIGENYEPYIFAALSSAKVMLVVATKGENCESVWVRNEWSRFISFMDKDNSKSIIPIYQNMTPYEFPVELSKYQAQDMSKVGAIQDLVRGIRKLIGVNANDANSEALSELIADKKERELRRKRITRASIVSLAVVVIAIISVLLYKNIFSPMIRYNNALDFAEKKQYQEAITILSDLDSYKDSLEKKNEVINLWFRDTAKSDSLSAAEKIFFEYMDVLDDSSVSALIERCLSDKNYTQARQYVELYKQNSTFEEKDLYYRYLTSIILFCKEHDQVLFEDIEYHYEDWTDHIRKCVGIYYSKEIGKILAIRESGSPFFMKMNNYWAQADLNHLMDESKYKNSDEVLYYDYMNQKYYISYESSFFVMDIIDNGIRLTLEDPKMERRVMYTLGECEGTYVKQ